MEELPGNKAGVFEEKIILREGNIWKTILKN